MLGRQAPSSAYLHISRLHSCSLHKHAVSVTSFTMMTIILVRVSSEPWQYPARSFDSYPQGGVGIEAVTFHNKMANMEPWQYPARIIKVISPYKWRNRLYSIAFFFAQ